MSDSKEIAVRLYEEDGFWYAAIKGSGESAGAEGSGDTKADALRELADVLECEEDEDSDEEEVPF